MLQIATQRLYSQKLLNSSFTTSAEVVAWLGVVQSQDYMGAKWALGQRGDGLTDYHIEQDFNAGHILRTHVLRPTWHFLAPADIRWMLTLSAPRVHAVNGTYYRKYELNADLFARSKDLFIKALEGNQYRTREQLAEVMQAAGVHADGLRLAYIMMHAELDQLICSGPRVGKQFTYALMDERVPSVPALSADEALGELAYRYFSSHGPATIRDYVWWSGLTVAQAKTGIARLGLRLNSEDFEGQIYYFAGYLAPTEEAALTAHLLPNYDEGLASYTDYSAIVEPQFADMWDGTHEVLAHHIAINGKVMGSWQRTIKLDTVYIQLKPFATLTDEQMQAVEAAAKRFGGFLELKVVLEWQSSVSADA